ncbi:MAG: energy transducer TonB [Bacteroidota bacterium]
MKHLFNILLIIVCCTILTAQKVSLEASAWSTPEICEDCTTCQDTTSTVSTSQKKLAFYCDDLLVGRWQLKKYILSACDSSYYSYTRGDDHTTNPKLEILLQNIFSKIKNSCSSYAGYELEILGQTKEEVETYFLEHFGTRIISSSIDKVSNTNPLSNKKLIAEEEIYDTEQLDIKPFMATCADIINKEEQEKCSEREMTMMLYKHMKYPVAARENGISGTTIVDLIIDKNGDIVSVELAKDLAGGCGQASLDAVYAMIENGAKFTPGYIDGKAVYTRFVLPMKYSLR